MKIQCEIWDFCQLLYVLCTYKEMIACFLRFRTFNNVEVSKGLEFVVKNGVSNVTNKLTFITNRIKNKSLSPWTWWKYFETSTDHVNTEYDYSLI
jgi:hypothetical protein